MRTRSIIRLLAALALATSLASAQTEAGQDADARRVEYQRGADAIVAKNWPEAERIFNDLWAQHHTFDVALNLGQIAFVHQRYRDAAQYLSFGIRNFPPRERTEALVRPKQALEEAQAHVAAVHVSVDLAGAEVLLDGEGVGTSPLEGELYVEPGPHAVEARLPNHAPIEQKLEAAAAQTQPVDLKFSGAAPRSEPKAQPAATEPPSSADSANVHAQYAPALVAGGVAVVGLVSGVVLFLEANHKDTQREDRLAQLSGHDRCGAQTPFPGECQQIGSLADDAKTFHALSIASFGVAVAGGVATYFLWPHSSAKPQVGFHILPLASATTVGAFTGIDGTF